MQREATTLLKQERRYQTGLESYIRSKTVPSLPRRLDTFNTAAVFTIIHAINFGHRSDEGVLSRVVPESIPTEKWQELVEQAHRVAYRILGNHIDAAEAVGNATVKVVSSETEPDNVGGYFVQTVKNEALRIRSKQQGRLVHSEDGWDLSSEDDGDVSDTCIAIEEEAMLAEAVSDLAPIDRTILRMRYWELKSFGEIGKALDMPEPTVRKRHQRALGTLRSRLVTTCEADRMLMVQA